MEIRRRIMRNVSIKRILIAVLAFFFVCSIGMFSISSVRAQEQTREFTMVKGASIRLVGDSNGIRFQATLSSYDQNNDYGFVIVPKSYIEDNQITSDYIPELNTLAETGTISEPIILYSKVHQENGKNVIKGSITNILYENINLEFVGIGFEYDGTTYNYASFENLDDIARDVPRVAAGCLNELYYNENIDEDDKVLYQDAEGILKQFH